mmetsp:Transcript_50558/g.126745  ORF Transcript_50558/g.126745 Transcript_50558/m.126745 type:complete len:271 (-) Transcript_50558:643-1455(-)
MLVLWLLLEWLRGRGQAHTLNEALEVLLLVCLRETTGHGWRQRVAGEQRCHGGLAHHALDRRNVRGRVGGRRPLARRVGLRAGRLHRRRGVAGLGRQRGRVAGAVLLRVCARAAAAPVSVLAHLGPTHAPLVPLAQRDLRVVVLVLSRHGRRGARRHPGGQVAAHAGARDVAQAAESSHQVQVDRHIAVLARHGGRVHGVGGVGIGVGPGRGSRLGGLVGGRLLLLLLLMHVSVVCGRGGDGLAGHWLGALRGIVGGGRLGLAVVVDAAD